MITHLEPEFLECQIKWALGSITMNKTSGGDVIPAELFQILKDDAVKVLYSICQQILKTQLEKVSFHSNPKERQCQRKFKLPHNCSKVKVRVRVSKVMFKILQARLQQYVNHELPDVQAQFRKGRGPRGQIANICWIS